MSTQPIWHCIANLGDVNPIDHGGLFVLVDQTGVYDAEAEYLDAPDDDAGTWYVYRGCLERCTDVGGVLSDNPSHPEIAAWFADDLAAVADGIGADVAELRADLCSGDALRMAHAYRAIWDHHGWENADAYPLQLTRDEAEARYAAPVYRVAP